MIIIRKKNNLITIYILFSVVNKIPAGEGKVTAKLLSKATRQAKRKKEVVIKINDEMLEPTQSYWRQFSKLCGLYFHIINK